MQTTSKIQWRAEDRPCPICGSKKANILGARGGQAHRQGKGVETQVVRCIDCKAVYQQPTLIPQSNPYSEYSGEEYFHGHQSQRKILNGEALAAFAETVLGKPGRMLELGCGRGELLRGAANRGWEVHGVEMTEGFAQSARSQGIEIECASIETCNSLKEVYEVVLLAAVLEHLYEPVETLERVRDALRPGGLVFIDVPNENSLKNQIGNAYMRLRGRKWATNLSPTFPPFHVVGFSPVSLPRLLKSTGFRVLSLEIPKWSNALPPKKGAIAKIEHMGVDVVQSLGKLIGMGDGIKCWAIRE